MGFVLCPCGVLAFIFVMFIDYDFTFVYRA